MKERERVIVMKFGGSSVADRDRARRVAGLVAGVPDVVVVVPAMGDTTDLLLRAGDHAERGQWAEAQQIVEQLRARHQAAVDEPEVQVTIQQLVAELSSTLHAILLLRALTPRSRAQLASYGERWSVLVVSAWIRAAGRPSEPVDARLVVVTDDRYDEATVDRDATRARLERRVRPMLDRGEIPVVAGGLGATADGITTTLGPGGAGYTAALLGALLGAREICIWTDVDGILTADPRIVAEARRLERVSYREAAELPDLGATALHPRAMIPAASAGIPIRVRGTFVPESPGTIVGVETDEVPGGVKTVTSIRGLALVTVEGTGLVGTPGIARRIFEATERAGVNVGLIGQPSSEQAVSLVVRAFEADRLVADLRAAFAPELAVGRVDAVEVVPDVAVLSIVGLGIAGRPGVAAKLFGALGAAGVNVLAIAQAASELSISVAIRDRHVVRAVRGVHTAFGLTRVVHLAVIGCGRVGLELLELLADVRETHRREHGLELRLVALATGRRLLIDERGLDPATAAEDLRGAPPRPDDETLIGRLVAQRHTDVVLVDVSAADTTELHRMALEVGFHVVTANKLPLAGPMDRYRELGRARAASRVQYAYEAALGAGLPVAAALRELTLTGDSLERVTGCFSGTLGFVCARLEDGLSLLDAVGEAERRGYTEPDAREDLSGRDVARKALIVARALGWSIEPDDVALEPLLPGLDAGVTRAVLSHGDALGERVRQAASRGEVVRYVAEIAEGKVRVGPREVPREGPIGAVRGPDNLVVLHTRRYRERPIVLRGPGSGAEVTAAGVLGDVLRIVDPAGGALARPRAEGAG